MNRDQARTVRSEVLAPHHDVASFDCRVASLNIFIQRHARNAPPQGLSQSWVLVDDDATVLAYYTLGIATVSRAAATTRVSKGMPNFGIPCCLLARFAVHRSFQGEGLGALMLQSAMAKAVRLGRGPRMIDDSPGLPLRAMLVHALDDRAAGFYRHHGFEPSPTDPLHLLVLLKDIKTSLP